VLGDGDAILAEGEGSWLSYVKINEKVMWRIDAPLPAWRPKGSMESGDLLLKSDTTGRSDLQPMIDGDWEEAEH